MNEGFPVVLVVVAVILVAVPLIAIWFWIKQKGKSEQPVIRYKKRFFAQWITGLIIALIAAFFMFDGDILGENTTGIAMVMGIVGIGLIATSNFALLDFRRNK